MDYIHIKSLEKYHTGYKDRPLKWAKIYFQMVQGNPDCEMITNEIDWARLVKFILLELQAQNPIPLDALYLTRKGFDLKKRPISHTLKELHKFIEVRNGSVTEALPKCSLDKEKDKEKDKDKESCVGEIIDDLNQTIGSSFKASSLKTQDLINARLKEGFTAQDFKTVHIKKHEEWCNDEKMSKFLRPETLYGNKFEGYLNQKESTKHEGGIEKWLKKD